MLSIVRRVSEIYRKNELDAYKKAIEGMFKIDPSDSTSDMKVNDDIVWYYMLKGRTEHLADFQGETRFYLKEYGTSLPCNRIPVGKSLVRILRDYIRNCGLTVDQLPNAKRFNIVINKNYRLSAKYSKRGDIKLHNSNNCKNTDMCMANMILITPEKVYLITNENLANHGINVNDYLKNTDDGLSLKRKILKKLKDTDFPYMFDCDIKIEESECKNKSVSEVFDQWVSAKYKAQKQ